MSLDKVLSAISNVELEVIEEMASQNHGPSDIAKALGVKKGSFIHIWRDPKSDIRKAYDRGILNIEITKTAELKKKVEAGSVTAIQMHEKRALKQRFEDAKNEVFGFNS